MMCLEWNSDGIAMKRSAVELQSTVVNGGKHEQDGYHQKPYAGTGWTILV